MNTMKVNLILLMNLVAIASAGVLNATGLNEIYNVLYKKLTPQCLHVIDEHLKYLDYCEIPKKKTISFPRDAEPYLCVFIVNLLIESCGDDKLFEKEKYAMNNNRTVCPFKYKPLKNNFDVDLEPGISYLKNEKNCKALCEFSGNLNYACKLMVALSELVNNKERDEILRVHAPALMSNSSAGNHTDNSVKSKPNVTVIQPVEVKKESIKTHTITEEIKEEIKHDKLIDKLKSDKSGNNNVNITSSAVHDAGNKTGSNNVKNDTHIVVDLKNENNNYNKISTDDVEVKDTQYNTEIDRQGLLDGETSSPGLNDHYAYRQSYSKKDDYDLSSRKMYTENDDIDDAPEKSDRIPEREAHYIQNTNRKEFYGSDNFFQAEDSHFSLYFLMTVSIIIIGYIIYHNKNKIVAYALEGRRNRNGRRRPTSSASYRKLDCNLEEAIASNPSHASVTNVVY